MKRFISWKILAIFVVTGVLSFYNLPASTQESILPFLPKEGEITDSGEVVKKAKILLGLDLQGGSQLDYKVDLRKVPIEDQQNIVDGVVEVLERRVNSLGVSEPNIYTSEVAGETHIVVELAETTDITDEDVKKYIGPDKTVESLTDDEQKLVSLEKAKATVGKTIQLEFKEEKGALDPQEMEKIRANAESTLARIKNGEDYGIVGQEEEQAFPGKVKYEKSEYMFLEDAPTTVQEIIKSMEPGQIREELVETSGNYTIGYDGNVVEETGLSIIKLIDKKEEKKNDKEVDVSHILIAYEGAESADASVTRSIDEAYELAKELEVKINAGEDFATLAKEYSDEPGAEETAGKLEVPVSGDGTYVYDFEQAALALASAGDRSEIIKTQFGYHIIKANTVRADVNAMKYRYEAITYLTVPDPWKETGLTGKNFVHADVQVDNFYQPYVQIQFDEEGGNLFEEITGRNIQKQVAIFVGGELISAPTVQGKIAGGRAQITGQFTQEEAQTLARDLNTGAIPAPIVLTGEYTIGATLGHEALNTSVKAGIFGLFLIMVFMMLYYRLSGLIASVALLIYAAIFIFLIKSQLHLGLALILSLFVFGFMVMQTLKNKDSAWEKFITFILACIAFFFLTFLLKTGVVLTLAGVAGIILSIGMAVDANILIFERFKEELRSGKTFSAAIDSGFARAWTAIRDSNFSTLITCAILFYFGSSIIRGFAFNLAAGIAVSMFTAIIVTRTLMQGFVGRKIAQNLQLFGLPKEKPEKKQFSFIKRSKIWLGFSGTLVALSILAIGAFGLNLGIDFTGGTLMEFNFSEPVTKDQLTQSINKVVEDINAGTLVETKSETATEPPTTAAEVVEPTSTTALTEDIEATTIDLTGMKVLQSNETDFIVKTKYLQSNLHDQLIAQMKTELPEFTEPRFTTIGPVIGQTLLQKAVFAIFAALIMIILYIGFAFRKVPKEVSPWRFGATAIIALAHDVIIVTGVFAVLGYTLNIEIDALFITAMLTVFGYSVNDTIVIFDRLRENLLRHSSKEDISEVTDISLNQTLARSINTSVSTLIALIAILIWGSPSIFYFILALTLGTAVGTYSSIFLASPILVKWNMRKR